MTSDMSLRKDGCAIKWSEASGSNSILLITQMASFLIKALDREAQRKAMSPTPASMTAR